MTVDNVIEVPGWSASAAVRAAESAILGAVIQSRTAADSAGEFVRAEDFAEPRHALVFEAATALADDGKPVNETAVLGELTRRGTVLQVGAGPGLLKLLSHAAVFGEIGYHAKIVADDAARRRLHAAITAGHQITSSPGFDVDNDVDLIRKKIDDAVVRVGTDVAPTVGDLLLDELEELERPLSAEDLLPPPYRDLEMIVPGLSPGQVIVIGARPAIGKSLTGLDWARAAAIRLRQPTLLHSLEMTRKEIMHRLLAAEATVNLTRFREHSLTDDDWQRIARIQDRILDAPLVIDDSKKCGLARVRSRLRGMARHGGCRLVVIDYLTLLEAPQAVTREREVAEITRGLKILADDFAVPIILLAQLNRLTEHRSDRKPMMSDLRESGAIEADADVVILLHREDAYEKEHPRAGEMDLIVAKHRNGPTGTATVAFQGRYGRSADMFRDHRGAA